MGLTIGTHLGSHEITALLGKGGMGEVYRARDLKLKREVAIKILPEEFSRDAERVSRFQREAEVLASLNHPNIAAIHDLQETNGTRYRVLELVEGETLADRIARGPLPVEEALNIAIQICEALEAAHERGIIHRDLKPANIKLTGDGRVKVLDFGLAKAMETTPPSATLSNSPTLLTGSMAGMIVGTAAYMSPEQARGRTADQRSDIFAFGCVLYEMLTGRQAFNGEDVSDILAAVMRVEADFNQLPNDLNPRVVELLRQCLAKNRKERRYAVGDVRLEIRSILTEPKRLPVAVPTPTTPFWKRAVLPIVAAVLAASTAALWITRPVPWAGHVVRYFYTLPKDQDFTRTGHQVLAISHDGSKLVYVANKQLYLKSIGEVEAKPIPGTNQDPDTPIFSPDGQWIAFYVAEERKLKKIPLAGGASVTLAEMIDTPFGASWAANDQILIGRGTKGIVSVPSGGGKPETVITAKSGEALNEPELLPNGQDVLFGAGTADAAARAAAGTPLSRLDSSQIVVQNLQSGTRKVVVQAGSEVHYIPTGLLIYTIGGTVYAVPFDLKKLQVTGGPVPVLEGVRRAFGAQTAATFLSFSDDGSLIWVAGSGDETLRILALVDRSGSRKVLSLPHAGYDMPRISPDGKHLAVGIRDSKDFNIWIYDLDGNASIRRLTFGGNNQSPAWTPDSKRIAFRSDRDGEGIYWQAADGSGAAERLIATDKGNIYDMPLEWTPDGKTLVFYIARGPAGAGSGVWTLGLDGEPKPQPLFTSASRNMRRTSSSPDGRWIAYSSNEEGDFSVYVQPFPPTGAKYKVSAKEVADSPLWTPDGKQIVFASAQRLMSVDVKTVPSFSFSEPKALPIEIENTQGRPYDITRDSKQFLVMQHPDESATPEKTSPQINVVLNWFRELQERVPVK
jgi:serine/threonine-protein kinase